MPLRIVSRTEWSSSPPVPSPGKDYVKRFNRVFLQNAYTDPCENQEVCKETLRQLYDRHVKKQHNPDIRFNFLVGGDGTVYEARGWHLRPVLPRRFYKMRNQSLLIGFLGNYTSETIPEQVHEATCDLIKYGVRNGHVSIDYHFYDIVNRTEFTDEDE